MPEPLPNRNADHWDYLEITVGEKFVLLVDYDGSRSTKVDEHLVASGKGAGQKSLRRNPSKFTFTIKVVTDAHMATYERALAACMSRSNDLTQLKVAHPALAQLDVHDLYLESVTALKPVNPGGMLTSRWSMVEKLAPEGKDPKPIQSNGKTTREKRKRTQTPDPHVNPTCCNP